MAVVNPSWLGSGTVTYNYTGHLLVYAQAVNQSNPSQVGGITIHSIGAEGNAGGNDINKTLQEYTGITFSFSGDATTLYYGDGTTIWEKYSGQVNSSWSTITWLSGSTSRLDPIFDEVVSDGWEVDRTKQIAQMTSIPGASGFSYGSEEWNHKLAGESTFSRSNLKNISDISEFAGAEFDFKNMDIITILVENALDFGISFQASGDLATLYWISPFVKIEKPSLPSPPPPPPPEPEPEPESSPAPNPEPVSATGCWDWIAPYDYPIQFLNFKKNYPVGDVPPGVMSNNLEFFATDLAGAQSIVKIINDFRPYALSNVYTDVWNIKDNAGYALLPTSGYSNGDHLLVVNLSEAKNGKYQVVFDDLGVTVGVIFKSGIETENVTLNDTALYSMTFSLATYTCGGESSAPESNPPSSSESTPISRTTVTPPAQPATPTQTSLTGGSILLLHSDTNPPTQPATPTPADFFAFGASVSPATSSSTDPYSFNSDFISGTSLTNNSINTIYYYSMDVAQNISSLGSVTYYKDMDKPTNIVVNPTINSPYTAEWLGVNKLFSFTGSVNVCDNPTPANGVGGGTGASPAGSGIIIEHFEYSTASTPSSGTSFQNNINATQCVVFDLGSRPDTYVNIAAQANGTDYYLHYNTKDKALNTSDFIKFDFKIDNDDPYILRFNNSGGCTRIAQDYLYVVQEVTDNTSGVVYYNQGSSKTGSNKITLTTNYVSPNHLDIFQQVQIGSTPGAVNVFIESYDQAENHVDNIFTVERTSQTINWITLTGARSSISPFVVEGTYKAEITPTSPELINGFFPTANLYYSPMGTDYDTSVGSQAISEQDFRMLVKDTNTKDAIMYLRTDGHPHACATKAFTFTSIDYSTLSATPPTLSIVEENQLTCTNKSDNYYRLIATAGNVTADGTTTVNGDLIIGYKITESSTSPGIQPTFNDVTGKFEDVTNVGWTVFVSGVNSFDVNKEFSFAANSFGTKTLYLHIATMAYSGLYASVSTGLTFSASTQIEYVNDFQGPTLSNVQVTDSNAVTENATLTSGIAPEQTFTKPTEVTADTITISGTLTDNLTSVGCTCVKRWVVGNFGNPPPYTLTKPGVWNIVSGTQQSINFTQVVTLNRPNSTKSIYVWAVDCVGNLSKNKIRITLNNPAYAIPDCGQEAGNVFKFEGKAGDEHRLRKTISAMYGDGVFHVGFISNKTSKIRLNRVHKLSEYRGLKIINKGNNDAHENLPIPNEPLKFSDFFPHKIPRIDDLTIVPFIPPVSQPAVTNVPQYVGDTRDIALTLDIDTGNNIVDHKLPMNDNLVDDSAKFFVDFIEEGSGLVKPRTFSYNPVTGHINNFVFDKPGVYFIIGFSSFCQSVSATYRIYKKGAPLPPIQGPPIDVPVPIGNPGGTTPVTIPFFIDQVSLAVDAAFVIDRSGSYVPGFSNAMYSTLSESLDALDSFAKNTTTNSTDSRYSVVWFWNPTSRGGIETAQNWTSDRSKIDAAVAKYKDSGSGGWEPKIEAIARVAGEDLVGPWRETALKLVLLYSDEPDGAPTNTSAGSSDSKYTSANSPDYFINKFVDNKVALLIFDAGLNYSDRSDPIGPGSTINQDNLLKAISDTSENGSVVQTLGLSASSADIVNAINKAFDKYKEGLSFDIEPDLSTPAIFKSKSANSAHPAGTPVPIPYNKLIDDGSRKKALFDVLLDNDEVYSLGTQYIITFVTIYNSSDIPIARKMIRIRVVP